MLSSYNVYFVVIYTFCKFLRIFVSLYNRYDWIYKTSTVEKESSKELVKQGRKRVGNLD